ncbi:unnamed protein product [Closterium sp. NIES-54]
MFFRVGGVSVTGVGVDEELAIGAGVVVVASASVDVAAAAVVSTAASVVSTAADVVVAAVFFKIWWVRPSGEVDDRVSVSSSLIWDEVKSEDVVLQDRFPDVMSAPPVVQFEFLSGAIGFKMDPFCHELADAK